MKRENVGSGQPWESVVGYSRAVRVGSFVHVAGTTATDVEGKIVGVGDPYRQAIQALHNIEEALSRCGVGMSDVVRTRIYVTNIDHWEAIGKAHGETFREVMPASTMVEVSRLVRPEMLVEIEAEAIVARSEPPPAQTMKG